MRACLPPETKPSPRDGARAEPVRKKAGWAHGLQEIRSEELLASAARGLRTTTWSARWRRHGVAGAMQDVAARWRGRRDPARYGAAGIRTTRGAEKVPAVKIGRAAGFGLGADGCGQHLIGARPGEQRGRSWRPDPGRLRSVGERPMLFFF
jgi:hypothetical protein